MCPDGIGKVGCGPQEEFRGCADVKITVDGVPDFTLPATTSTTSSTTPRTRTRGTITSRYTRPTSKPPTVSSSSTQTTTVETTTRTTTTESPEFNEIIPPDRYGGVNPGTYIGIIIALATLLFAILLLLGLILYFYHCHRDVKAFVRKHLMILRERMTEPTEPKLPPKLPASVFATHPPPSVTTSAEIKPPVPPRTKRHPNHANMRLLSLTISEPLDVAINGVSVSRDGVPPNGTDSEEANVSTA